MNFGKQVVRHLKQYSKHYEITKEAMKKPRNNAIKEEQATQDATKGKQIN
jgi:hypothetical protein